jgi:membrane-associated phospholipid phosphatase
MGSMAFLSLYIFYFWRNNGVERQSDLLLVLAPITFAFWVGATRVVDYYHNATDVLAGAIVGLAIATLCFYTMFPRGQHTLVPASPVLPISGTGSSQSQQDLELPPV